MDLKILRNKWNTVPSGDQSRINSRELLNYSDAELNYFYDKFFSTDNNFDLRGWYHNLYGPLVRKKNVLDIGSGLGLSPIYFAKQGANVTFSDIVKNNLKVVEKYAKLHNIEAEYIYIKNVESFKSLTENSFDFVFALGSLHHAPSDFIKNEIKHIIPLLKPENRFIIFAYPKSRWIKEGALEFSSWGEKTDGTGTPWAEFIDKDKIKYLFDPYEIVFNFDCEWHDKDFNWFDFTVKK